MKERVQIGQIALKILSVSSLNTMIALCGQQLAVRTGSDLSGNK